MSSYDDVMACAVCGRVLSHHEGRGYAHSLQDLKEEDHPAVPVPAGSVPVRGRCDFCNVDHPVWAVPARTFSLIPGHSFAGGWAACGSCVEYVKSGDWDGLASHAAADPEQVPLLRILYQMLGQNVTGEPAPLR